MAKNSTYTPLNAAYILNRTGHQHGASARGPRLMPRSPPLRQALPGPDGAAWHLTDGPVGPASRWAATSNIEVGRTTYPVNRGRVGREGEKVEEREWNDGEGLGALS